MTSGEVRPYGDKVLVRVEDEAATTAGGIHIPDSARERMLFAKVVAVGPDADSDIVAGKQIIFERYAGNELHLDDGDFVLMPSDSVLAVEE